MGARTEEMERGLQNVKQRLNNFGDTMLRTGGIMTAAVTVPIVAGFAKIVKEAADAEELYSKFNTVFGEYADEVRGWADEHANIWGRSSQDLQGYLANSQNLLVGFGASRGEASKLSQDMVTLATDLASFNNIADSDAMGALQSALLGNHEAAKALDVIINENTLSMAMADLGYEGNFQSLSELEKIQVRYHAVVMQSTDAMGDAERTSQSYTNRVKALQGRMKDLSAELGKHLLPYLTKIVEKIGILIEKFGDMSPETQKFILLFVGIIAVIGPLLILIGLIAKGVAILIGVFGALSLPILIIIGVVVALIAIFVKLWRENEDFRNKIIALWTQIKEKAIELWEMISKSLEDNAGTIQEVWGLIVGIVEKSIYIILEIINLVLALLTGDWAAAWNSLKNIARASFESLFDLGNIGAIIVQAIADGILGKITEVVNAITELWRQAWSAFASGEGKGGGFSGTGAGGTGGGGGGGGVDGAGGGRRPASNTTTSTKTSGSMMHQVTSNLGKVTASFKGLFGADSGGIVPGIIGSPQLILAHGGETVLPTHKPGWQGSGGNTIRHEIDLINVPATVDGASLERTLVEMLNAPQVKRKIDRVNYENQIGAVRGLGA